jgi:hypothetical protein
MGKECCPFFEHPDSVAEFCALHNSSAVSLCNFLSAQATFRAALKKAMMRWP